MSVDMAGVKRFEELRVYQLCDRLRILVRPFLERPGFNRDLDLKDQLHRAVEGPCPNIAEGFLRFNPRENAQLVRVAKSSAGEVVVQIGRALAGGLVTSAEHEEVVDLATQAIKALTRYINYLDNVEIPGTPPPRSRRPHRRTPGNSAKRRKRGTRDE